MRKPRKNYQKYPIGTKILFETGKPNSGKYTRGIIKDVMKNKEGYILYGICWYDYGDEISDYLYDFEFEIDTESEEN